jgi:hypothetical protein
MTTWKIAAIIMVKVLGSVEKWKDHHLTFMKNKLHNWPCILICVCPCSLKKIHTMQPLHHGRKFTLNTTQIVRFVYNHNFFLLVCFKCLYYFFQKSKYEFWMNYVEVGKSCRCVMIANHFSSYVGVELHVWKPRVFGWCLCECRTPLLSII